MKTINITVYDFLNKRLDYNTTEYNIENKAIVIYNNGEFFITLLNEILPIGSRVEIRKTKLAVVNRIQKSPDIKTYLTK